MPLEYKSQVGLEAIMPVLDEHVLWYGRLIKSYFEGKPSIEPAPAVFSEWLAEAVTTRKISGKIAERVRRIHADMVLAADKFTSLSGIRADLPLKEYNDLNGHYEEFIQILRRLEFDQALENSGFDERTGLRSVKLMDDDLAREFERRARRGNPFVLALVKVNEYEPAWGEDDVAFRGSIRKISDQIRLCLRSFDDAYYLGDAYFLLILKHSDMVGAQSAIVRLNQAIRTLHVHLSETDIRPVSLSTVLSEPLPGDSAEMLVDNMKKDIEKVYDKGVILQYNDISPLQRYIQSISQD